MFELLLKVFSVVFNPLLGLTKDKIYRSKEPRKRMVESMLRLYENFKEFENDSIYLLNEIEKYVEYDKIAWTVTISKKERIASVAERLRQKTNKLGVSIHQLYNMLEIKNEKLLLNLIGIHHGKKQRYYGALSVTPMIDFSDKPLKEGTAKIYIPKDKILDIKYNNDLLREYYHHPEKIKNDYLDEVDIDDKDLLLKILSDKERIIVDLGTIKESIKGFIKENFSIEDFFR